MNPKMSIFEEHRPLCRSDKMPQEPRIITRICLTTQYYHDNVTMVSEIAGLSTG